jgi:hypothetical protein
VREQLHSAAPVPTAQRVGLVLALDIVRQLDLQDRLGAVGQPHGCDELRVGRLVSLADHELPRPWDRQCAPSAETPSDSTVSSGNRSSSARAHVSASSAQTITVGPDPDNVAPTAPAGSSARIASSSAEGR